MMRWTEKEIEHFSEDKRKVMSLKKEIMMCIYPNREYICYFTEYFPQWNNMTAKFKIRDTWSGRTCNGDVIKMMEYIVEQLKKKTQ